MKRLWNLTLLIGVVAVGSLAVGCGSNATPTAAAPVAPAVTAPPPPPGPPAPPAPPTIEPGAPVGAEVPSGTEAPVDPAAGTSADETERVKATKGVGKAGRSLDEHEGMVVTPVKTLFAAKERIVFEIQIPQALALFYGLEGRFPESHDEYMEKVITANQIPLPVLPEGHKYVYDVETHELMVERPKK